MLRIAASVFKTLNTLTYKKRQALTNEASSKQASSKVDLILALKSFEAIFQGLCSSKRA